MTVAINHHIVITDDEQCMIVNALAFFHQYYKYTGDDYRTSVVDDWQPVADDSDITKFDSLARKIATSN